MFLFVLMQPVKLKLQAASVVINVDALNPAVLQRFGRVDRLGQKSPEVDLVNLYYPNTIEERMYQVLSKGDMTLLLSR